MESTELVKYEQNSKYFVKVDSSSSEELVDSCKEYGLKAFEIRHYDDFLSIQRLLRKIIVKRQRPPYTLGITYNSEVSSNHGQWKYPSGDDLEFSAWDSMKPNNYTVCTQDSPTIFIIESLRPICDEDFCPYECVD